ncbi:MAG: ATP-binding cassette domain-containing protein, partial [Micrococcales bacterium]|nr:ATP-binding cassette domain-containing protein [Micrococcales bacterium]
MATQAGGGEPAALITLSHVTCGYRNTPVLHDVSLTLGAGFHIVMGPNGSGKTTLFRAIGGVILPMSGTITLSDGGTIGYVMHRSAF